MQTGAGFRNIHAICNCIFNGLVKHTVCLLLLWHQCKPKLTPLLSMEIHWCKWEANYFLFSTLHFLCFSSPSLFLWASQSDTVSSVMDSVTFSQILNLNAGGWCEKGWVMKDSFLMPQCQQSKSMAITCRASLPLGASHSNRRGWIHIVSDPHSL